MSSAQLAVIERQLKPLEPMFADLLRPTGVPAARLIRSVIISCDRTPKLLECTPLSVIQAATTGAVLGLEADGHTGQGFLVPFRQKGVQKAQWLTGYKGFNTLGARVGLTIAGAVVREGDAFDYELGSAAFVRHKPQLGAGWTRRIVAAWACAAAPGRDPIVVVMDLDELLAIKARSAAAKRPGADADGEAFSPWNEPLIGFPAMCAKTAKRRLARSLPLSAYIGAARVDEAHEEQGRHAFLHPDRGVVIDGEAAPLAEGQPPPEPAPLARPVFLIRNNKGERRVNSIEQWRGEMLRIIASLRDDSSVERCRDMNAVLFDQYAERHPREVRAVIDAIEARLRGDRGPMQPGEMG
ncbi:MAG: recombinase RecT [Candidatus Binataceae bacterium]|nr:recombinase RecT [Candidatus Binataceae bacterium]